MMTEVMAEMIAERQRGLRFLEQFGARNRREYREFREEFDRNLKKIDRRHVCGTPQSDDLLER